MPDIQNLKVVLYWLGMALFLVLELRRPYRTPTVTKSSRWLANLPLILGNGLLYHLIYTRPILELIDLTQDRKIGLLQAWPLPNWLEWTLAVLILDFFIYIWHLLNHEIPLFARFHQVHHSDIDMDVSTASRFHFGELFLSGLVRLAIVYTFGIPLAAYFLFEITANIAIQFHHSSIRVPASLERAWICLFVPPSMHRIHHSVKRQERNSNYGVIFSVWDRLLGTLIQHVDQKSLVIGLPAYRQQKFLGVFRLWLMPFLPGIARSLREET